MEKDRKTKIIAIAALLVGTFALTIGFAAFASNLSIQSGAEFTPNENDFKVNFSTDEDSVVVDVVSAVASGVAGAVGTEASIENGVTTSSISNLNATFTDPGQKITYSFYAVNAGKYEAFLNAISFANATNGNSYKKCTPGTDTNAALVESACENISLKVTVGSLEATPSTTGIDDIDNHSLQPTGNSGNGESVIVEIEYAANAARPDGDFTVSFGDVTLTYEAVD